MRWPRGWRKLGAVIRATLLGVLFVLASCSPNRTANGPSKTEVAKVAPADLLPSGELVIRIDAARLREHPLMMGLTKGGDARRRDKMFAGEGSGVVRLILPEIELARSIVMGGRLTAGGTTR